MTSSVKPFATIGEQVTLLESRGLTTKPAVAEQWLRTVGYYRLSGYWYPYRELGGDVYGGRLDGFVTGATFDDVIQLYEFDRKLRTFIHDGVERVEVALRSQLGYLIGSIGPLAYLDASIFRPNFKHENWLDTAKTRTNRARRHSEPIRHHEKHYNGELPIWVLTEVLDFADVSILYEGLLAKDQWYVAEQLGVKIDIQGLSANQRSKVLKAHPLARWMEQLTVVRNACAHHSRVWNRPFTPVSTAGLRTIEELHSLPEGQSERLYGALTVMAHMLQSTSPGSTWAGKVGLLIENSFSPLLGRSVAEMGFPIDWRNQRLWSP
jgi:abortive infection bacteriophage resistance protein